MVMKRIIRKSITVILIILSTILSMLFAFLLLAFIFNPQDKNTLQLFIVTAITGALMWGFTFFVASPFKGKSQREHSTIIRDLFSKIPLILLSSIITSVYVIVYFFIFSFLTVSEYGKGGLGGDAGEALTYVFVALAIILFTVVMYKVYKTDKQDISLIIFNQFSVLKWSSLIALPFGIWSTYYFYREEGVTGWIAMIVWSSILYFVYAMMKRIADKVHDSIIDANLNRIIHEKKKKMVNQEILIKEAFNRDIYEELGKLHQLVKEGILTSEEFENQKKKLLSK